MLALMIQVKEHQRRRLLQVSRAPTEKMLPGVWLAGGVPESHSELSSAMQPLKLQYLQDSSPEKEPSGLLRRYVTQAHILQSRKKPEYLICFTETSSPQTR